MQRRRFSREFKLEAVREAKTDPQHAFPGQGQVKLEQLEIDRLRREVAPLTAERDILKKAAAFFAREAT